MDNEQIKSRILWKLRRTMPALTESLTYDSPSQQVSGLLREVISEGRVDLPILLFPGPGEGWTILGTRALACREGEGATIIPILKIKDFTPVIGSEQTKLSFEHHVLQDVDGQSHSWWTPAGTSIALRLAMDLLLRMQKPTQS